MVVIDDTVMSASAFVTASCFHPSLICVSKAGAYREELHCKSRFLALLSNVRLGLAMQNTLAYN